MYAVVVTYEKTDIEDKITYSLVEAENLVRLANTGLDVEFTDGKKHGEVYFFDTLEEAERNMGAK